MNAGAEIGECLIIIIILGTVAAKPQPDVYTLLWYCYITSMPDGFKPFSDWCHW